MALSEELKFMRLALRLAAKGYGTTSPNPMVGAILVKGGRIIGRGWHRGAGRPHAEIEALRDAERRGHVLKGATLYVTLEPCCTHGRTPPCTEAIIQTGIKRVVVGTMDPNPRHSGRAFRILRRAGVSVTHGVLAEECERLNEAFNHWIVHRTPFVTVKAAMTLDGKIATASGESKWITGEKARQYGMKLRQGADAILVGINTVLADDPSLTVRSGGFSPLGGERVGVRGICIGTADVAYRSQSGKNLRRILLDSQARTPLTAKVVSDAHAPLTTIVVAKSAPQNRVAALAKRVNILVAPLQNSKFDVRCSMFDVHPSRLAPRPSTLDLPWLLRKLGAQNVTSLLVEGGGEVNASFLLGGLAQRIAFFYAPKILGGRDSRKAVAGDGATRLQDTLNLTQIEWRRLGPDLFLTALVQRGTG